MANNEYFEVLLRDSGSDTYEVTIPKKIAELKQMQVGERILISIQKKEVIDDE